jgi:hypothetical protein
VPSQSSSPLQVSLGKTLIHQPDAPHVAVHVQVVLG